MPWDTGDLLGRIEELRRDQRAQVQISEEAMTAHLSALAAADRAEAVMRHCADCLQQDADEIDRILEELPRAES